MHCICYHEHCILTAFLACQNSTEMLPNFSSKSGCTFEQFPVIPMILGLHMLSSVQVLQVHILILDPTSVSVPIFQRLCI